MPPRSFPSARPLSPGAAPLRATFLRLGTLAVLFALASPVTRAEDRPSRMRSTNKMFDPRFREGAPSDALVAGPPRLSRGHLHAFVDLFEAAFDIALPARVEQDLRDALEEKFLADDKAGREAQLDLVDGIVELRARARHCDWRAIHAGLRRFRAAVDKRLQAAPDEPAHRILLRVLRRRHEVVWRGEPALKALAVEAYLEMVVFVASLRRNEQIQLSPGQVSALRDYLGKDLRRCGYGTRNAMVDAHRTWLRVKARWDRSRDSRRLAMRWEAVQLLARLAPKPGGVKICVGKDHMDYARQASKVAVVDASFNAVTAVARNPKALLVSLCRGLGLSGKAPPLTLLYR